MDLPLARRAGKLWDAVKQPRRTRPSICRGSELVIRQRRAPHLCFRRERREFGRVSARSARFVLGRAGLLEETFEAARDRTQLVNATCFFPLARSSMLAFIPS